MMRKRITDAKNGNKLRFNVLFFCVEKSFLVAFGSVERFSQPSPNLVEIFRRLHIV